MSRLVRLLPGNSHNQEDDLYVCPDDVVFIRGFWKARDGSGPLTEVGLRTGVVLTTASLAADVFRALKLADYDDGGVK